MLHLFCGDVHAEARERLAGAFDVRGPDEGLLVHRAGQLAQRIVPAAVGLSGRRSCGGQTCNAAHDQACSGFRLTEDAAGGMEPVRENARHESHLRLVVRHGRPGLGQQAGCGYHLAGDHDEVARKPALGTAHLGLETPYLLASNGGRRNGASVHDRAIGGTPNGLGSGTNRAPVQHGDLRPSVQQRARHLISTLAAGKNDRACTGHDAIQVDEPFGGSGQHHAWKVGVPEQQRLLEAAGGNHRMTRADSQETLRAGGGDQVVLEDAKSSG